MVGKLTANQIQKLELREEKLMKRHKLKAEEMRAAMIKVSEEVQDIINLHRRIKCVAVYSAINKEIDMTFLSEMLMSKGIKIALPRAKVKNEPLTFNEWDLMPATDKDAEGIPCSTGKEIKPDVFIVPLVAFTRGGHRIGYGSGYYDRTFNAIPEDTQYLSIGVGYAFQEIEDVKVESHDVALNYIVTEKETLKINA